MLPVSTLNYRVNSAARNSESQRECDAGARLCVQPTDFNNIYLRQLSVPMALSAHMGPVPLLIRMVAASGIPSQVDQPVVRRIAVVVAALHAVRAEADKGFEYEAVDESAAGPHGRTQLDNAVTVLALLPPKDAAPKNPARGRAVLGGKDHKPFDGAKAPMVGNFVQPIPPDNGLPIFSGQVLNGVSHDRLLGTVAVRGRRARQRSRPRLVYSTTAGGQA